MSGIEMYKRLADGRHERLVELPSESADGFKQWYHSGRGGGHPWEVYRGGNTTHIDLGVTEKEGGWSVFLNGNKFDDVEKINFFTFIETFLMLLY